jgi:CRISPR/Cas system Type II protein with McrA/HNH and RuvC-like nuclease domain
VPQAGRIAKFHLEHIFPFSHDGTSDFDNLAWACSDCNQFKGTNVASIDFETGNLIALFNPRTQI